MKYLVLFLLAAGAPSWQLLTWVHDRNSAVATGTAAYQQGDAPRAAAAFEAALLAKARADADPRLVLNLAHAQTRAGQLAPAQTAYGRLLTESPAPLSSVAHQQLAVLAAQQGEIAEALTLLRRALLLDPKNSGARYDYEVLSDYLARKPNSPKIPAPAPPPASQPNATKPASPEKNGSEPNQPAEKPGSNRQGEINDPKPAPPSPTTPPERRPDAGGQPDNQQADGAPGTAARSGRAPGTGTPQPIASGDAPGSQRGLDRSSAAAGAAGNGRNNRAGTDAATGDDASLQTQRERLEAMNLTPAQARQLLETLRAQEQQYLQQLTRPAAQKPDPSKPTW
ncbi:tetratricopeptide repeat protein [Hymenobacter arizonensis]|uniref:Tetratricopeptide repeat-containing protein n=1 Tax=Hymenobacter arizonensis TaxID=1227077 RepID=A0A1I5T6V6_HYMAR|nr:tetratricopeptide repeat protein [Hymenobacter arizonensis]SFP78770.1 Tetratricopeptide repeat-containing protein [Hymenobacter arizonensis]